MMKEFKANFMAKLDDNKEEMRADKEEAEAKRRKDHENFMAKLDTDRKAWREQMTAWRNEIAAMTGEWGSDSSNVTLACQELEAHVKEGKPASAETKPEAAQIEEVPAEDAEVMPVGEPKKKRRRDRKLAMERRRQTPNVTTREHCGPRNRLAVAR